LSLGLVFALRKLNDNSTQTTQNNLQYVFCFFSHLRLSGVGHIGLGRLVDMFALND